MITSAFVLALSGLMQTTVPDGGLSWMEDYRAARQQAAQIQKPLCVVLGQGQTGWQKLSDQGQLTKQTQQLLAQKYICVYVDTTTSDGKQLAKDFEVSSGLGIVISDKTGDLQAFRHQGNLTNAKLEKYLQTFSDTNRQVLSTISNPENESTTTNVRTSYYSPTTQPSLNSSYQPYSSYGGYAPSYGIGGYGGGFGGYGGGFSGGFGGSFGGCAGGT